ncbi:MAG: hypothetical protein NTW85_00055 [Methylococcales bacterium]|nr:hypothetical protein [Methylococcales bacterium]
MRTPTFYVVRVFVGVRTSPQPNPTYKTTTYPTYAVIANQESTYSIKDHLGSVHNTLGINSQTLSGNANYLPYGLEYGNNTSYPLNDFRYAGLPNQLVRCADSRRMC